MLMHFIYTAILKSLSGHSPGVHFGHLNRDKKTQVWLLRQMEDLHSKDLTYCQNHISTRVLFIFKYLLPWVVLPTWQNYVFLDKSTGNLMTDLDLMMVVTLYRSSQPPNKLSIRGMSLVWESGATGWSILMSKHLPPSILNFTYL